MLTSAILESKLQNGNMLDMNLELPLVSIRIRNPDNKNLMAHFCTGYYISTDFALTSGRCVRRIKSALSVDSKSIVLFLKWYNSQKNSIPCRIKYLEHLNDFNKIFPILPKIDVGLLLVGLLLH